VSDSDFVIVRASAGDDLADVETLQNQSFTNPWRAEALRWELRNTNVARLYLMRTRDAQLVAYCACWIVAGELHINSLAVDEGWRRRGVATRLLTHILRDAVSEGAGSATLEVRESNAAARLLYEHLGFRVEAIRRDYYREPREDALILWRRTLAGSDGIC
jgi:ribosomal-protein-alanine N-acetyltransferase